MDDNKIDPTDSPRVADLLAEDEAQRDAQRTPSEWQALYMQEKKRREDTEAILNAARVRPAQPIPGADVKPKTFEQARAQVGVTRWNHTLTNSDRLLAMGQDPNQDLGFVRQLWGKGADPRIAQDLFKSNPKKYRETKEAALALGIWRN